MRRFLRSRPSVLAALALIAAMGSTPLVSAHSEIAEDAACLPMLVAHDASAHRFVDAQGTSSAHRDHCFTCHWQRSLQSTHPTTARLHLVLPIQVHLPHETPLVEDGSARTRVPARAPPLA